jgi:hypothetical protein
MKIILNNPPPKTSYTFPCLMKFLDTELYAILFSERTGVIVYNKSDAADTVGRFSQYLTISQWTPINFSITLSN